MAYGKLISAEDIVKTAVRMIEAAEGEGLSLRAVAASLGVKAPSLYRYYPDKNALELAVAEEALKAMQAELKKATRAKDAERTLIATAEAYLRFTRERFPLYAFVMHRVPEMYGSAVGKAVWNLLLEATSGVSEQPDDTAAAVAVWSFLHGYATLEHSGAFGASGPKGGLDLGLTAFLNNFRRGTAPVRKNRRRRRQKPSDPREA